MNNTVIQVNAKDYGLDGVKASKMISGLVVTKLEREVLKEAYLDVLELDINEENIPIFKNLRLKIVKNRTGLGKWKEKEKAFYLSGGNFIQAIYNKEVLVNKEMESKLMEAEKHFENLEKIRLEKLQADRVALLSEFVEDAFERDLVKFEEDEFKALLSVKKKEYLDNIKKELDNEIKRKEQKDLEVKRLEDQRLENYKLKKDALKREKEIELERIKIKKENDAKLKIENDARLKIEAELKAKQLEEARLIGIKNQEIIKAKKDADKLLKAPIKKQLNLWIESFNIEIPNSELLNNEKALIIKSKFDSFKNWAKSEVNNL